MKKLIVIFFLCIGLNAQTITLSDGDILAIPKAIGHGQNTTGGRGKPVYRVTNNNNSGTGSLRQALSDCAATDGGNIVFTTGMTITLTSIVYFASDNVTIWGQSASGTGVTVHGQGMDTNGYENIIIQHIRIRPGDGADADTDALRLSANFVTGERRNFYIAHNSFSWSDDEAISIESQTNETSSMHDISIAYNVISEPFGSKYGSIVWKENSGISYIGNYFANVSGRNPENTTPNAEFEVINNVMYGYSSGVRMAYDSDLDLVGNTFKLRTGTSQSFETLRIEVGTTSPTAGNVANTKYFSNDNTLNGGAITIGCAGCTASNYAQGSRIHPSTYTPLPRAQAKDSVFAKAGARNMMEGVDALDSHMFADYDAGTGGWPDNEAGTTGLPTMTAGTAYTDSDSDGLSDAYESANGGSVTQSTRPATATLLNGKTVDQSGVTSYASNGYTHLEIFMAERANQWGVFETSGGSTPIEPPNGSQLKKKSGTVIWW